jgi:hypothetical protein
MDDDPSLSGSINKHILIEIHSIFYILLIVKYAK